MHTREESNPLFGGVVWSIARGCKTGHITQNDLTFLIHLPAWANFYGDRVELARTRQQKMFAMLQAAPQPLRVPRAQYHYCQKTIQMHQQGYGIRTIAKVLNRTKANVERNIREYREGTTVQLWFDFFREVPVDKKFVSPKSQLKVAVTPPDDNQELLPIQI